MFKKFLVTALIALASFLAGAISAGAAGKCGLIAGTGDVPYCNVDGSCGITVHCVFIDCALNPGNYDCNNTTGAECNTFSCWFNSGCNPCVGPPPCTTLPCP